MPFINLNEELPGITALFVFSPETARPMSELAEALLRREDKTGQLTRAEREIIAAYVSFKNDCKFCHNSHNAVVKAYLNIDFDYLNLNFGEKFNQLLQIAALVAKKSDTEQEVKHAKELGATDSEIHDTVLIAAAFCMFNRYVDGLGAPLPAHDKYQEIGQKLATQGYFS
jgi:alkylhydroperoxidase family enzyme